MSRGCIHKFWDFHVTISKQKILVMLSTVIHFNLIYHMAESLRYIGCNLQKKLNGIFFSTPCTEK